MNTKRGTPKTIEGAIEHAIEDAIQEAQDRWGKDWIFHDVSGDRLIPLLKAHVQEFIANRSYSTDPVECAYWFELFYRIFPEAPRNDRG